MWHSLNFSSALPLNAQGSYMRALSIRNSMQCPYVALPFIGADPEPFKTSFFSPWKGEREAMEEKSAERASALSFNFPPRGPFVRESVWSESTVCSCPAGLRLRCLWGVFLSRILIVRVARGARPAAIQTDSYYPLIKEGHFKWTQVNELCMHGHAGKMFDVEPHTLSRPHLLFDQFCCHFLGTRSLGTLIKLISTLCHKRIKSDFELSMLRLRRQKKQQN